MIHMKQGGPPETARAGPGRRASVGRKASARSTNRRQEPLRSGDESGGGPRRQLHVGLICRRSGCRHCESPRTVPHRTTLACGNSPRSRHPDPTTRRARRLRTTRPRHLVHDTSADRIDAAQVRPEQHDGRLGGGGPPARLDGSHEGAPRTGCTPRVSTALGITPLGIVRHALSSRRPHHLSSTRLQGRTVPTPSIRTVVTGAGEGRIITLIHVKHVGRRIGRHADATCAGLNAPLGCHSDETPGGAWTVRRRCRSTRYVRADLSLSHNMFRFTASGFSESAPRNRPTRTVPFEPGNSRGQTP